MKIPSKGVWTAMSKECIVCGKHMERMRGQPVSVFKSIKACSNVCKIEQRANAVIARAENKFGVGCLDPKCCVICDRKFSRGSTSPTAYTNKSTCSPKCTKQLAGTIRHPEIGIKIPLSMRWNAWTEDDKRIHNAITSKAFGNHLGKVTP
jgi:hypothetical protein